METGRICLRNTVPGCLHYALSRGASASLNTRVKSFIHALTAINVGDELFIDYGLFIDDQIKRSPSNGQLDSGTGPFDVIRTCSSSFTPSRPPFSPMKLSTETTIFSSNVPS